MSDSFELPLDGWFVAKRHRQEAIRSLILISDEMIEELGQVIEYWLKLRVYVDRRILGDELPQKPYAQAGTEVKEAFSRYLDHQLRFCNILKPLLLELKDDVLDNPTIILLATGWLLELDLVSRSSSKLLADIDDIIEPLKPIFASTVAWSPTPELKPIREAVANLITSHYADIDKNFQMSINLRLLIGPS